jgi:hypothetical protein
MLREQVRAERVAMRRRAVDEWLWEREGRPMTQGGLEVSRKEPVRTGLRYTSSTESCSGKALNDVLAQLGKSQDKGQPSRKDVALDQDIVKQINLAVGKGGGSLSLLKDGKQLSWPATFEEGEFKAKREQVNGLTEKAFQQLTSEGKVNTVTLQKLHTGVEALQNQLGLNAGDLTVNQYIEAKVFLVHLNDTIVAIQQPSAKEYLDGKYTVKAKTVSELVTHMKKHGLQFAPALPGGEQAYTRLHQALCSYRDSGPGAPGKK